MPLSVGRSKRATLVVGELVVIDRANDDDTASRPHHRRKILIFLVGEEE